MKAQFTFGKRYGALTAAGKELVYVPDQVIDSPLVFDGQRFPVMKRDGRRRQAILRGGRFGLGTEREGDPVVALT